jgi:L-2-hydroxyglutarate oxidase LhgO
VDIEKIDCLVIGAGVIGLSIARALALAGREVIVVEQRESIGLGTSSRNSEIIHAGIYYQTASLKARFCVEGKNLLYQYCQANGIAYRRIEKLIVAHSSEQEAALEAYRQQGLENGVKGLSMLCGAAVTALEPALAVRAGLLSDSTGIVDSSGLMQQLQADCEGAQGHIFFQSPVVDGEIHRGTARVALGGISKMALDCNWVINAAGLESQRIAACLGQPRQTIPKQYLAKGHYFSYGKKLPFNRLIYPVADQGGLGIHLTFDMAGHARFGPDITWINKLDYSFDESRKNSFARSIRCYFPDLDMQFLQPAYTGIRPKLSGPNDDMKDFVIQGEAQHGFPGLINLFGIESPGLTAALAIGNYIKNIINH